MSLFSTIYAKRYSSKTSALPNKSILVDLELGYFTGLGFQSKISFMNLNHKIPLSIELGFGYFKQTNSGNATEARHIFINDNEGGSIEKDGTSKLFLLNIAFNVHSTSTFEVHLYTGPRYVFYTAKYAFIGDNEIFYVKTNELGWSLGITTYFKLTAKLFLNLNIGFSFYKKSLLEAHGTFYYRPDNIDDEKRTNNNGYTYTYEDADNAVNQPDLQTEMSIAIGYKIY